MGSIPGLGKFSGEGKGNSLQYSCQGIQRSLEATVHGAAEWDMTEAT